MAKLPTLPTYEQHPLAIELMPGGMNPEEFEAFCDDVAERGILMPVSLFEGKVLDGWHRYRAAHKTGTAFKTIEYNGEDPAGYIASCNIHRRKLSSLQRALFAARVHLRNGVNQRDICKRYSISNTVLSMMLKVISSRNVMLIRRVENDGDFTRGMLREALEEVGLVHENYGRTGSPAKNVPNSVFDMGRASADTDGNDGPEEEEDEDEDIVGEPVVGKRPSHPERRAKDTPAQKLQAAWKDLHYDEKTTFVQMVWADLRAVAEEQGLPGLSATETLSKTVAKAKRTAKVK